MGIFCYAVYVTFQILNLYSSSNNRKYDQFKFKMQSEETKTITTEDEDQKEKFEAHRK